MFLPLLLLTNLAYAVEYSSTGFEQTAQDTIVFKLDAKDIATTNFRTVCDKIYGSDLANCSVRLYDGRAESYDPLGQFLEVYKLECSLNQCMEK